jgi:hypothetical protein
MPALLGQCSFDSSISSDVLLEFFAPKGDSRFRHARFRTTPMSVPKTTIRENNGFSGTHHQVGTAWKSLDVQAISNAERIDKPADDHLRFGVSRPNARHQFASAGRRQPIHEEQFSMKRVILKVPACKASSAT